MKKQGMVNSHIAKVLADLGHTDLIVIADLGLPVPPGVLKIDLAVTQGTPGFQDVVSAVAADMVVERVIVAEEINSVNMETMQYIEGAFPDSTLSQVPHEQFKELTRQAKAIIRTGEARPYANCILQSGVHFG
ncbi:D-ribose pyranase [Paenibacillus sp. F411]|uniref:D-ribose pyranase n=1 Tax=unclassified Paenibacillus TaxID=185978 RepID=UPI001AAE7C0F|nr:D-ribose pyranase [Paenibacillus sp. F411]MBO2945334.1 D-ribose pyranase [Paenibacillus sp. F411]